MLDQLRKKAENLYNFTKKDNYLNIMTILESDDCFLKLDVDMAISILMDLGFEKEEAKKIYIKLISKENVEDEL